jgi:hypothetical protein
MPRKRWEKDITMQFFLELPLNKVKTLLQDALIGLFEISKTR